MFVFFRVFDKDGSGTVSQQELMAVLCNVGDTLTEDEVRDLMTSFDTDQDGQLSFDELKNLMFDG